MMGHKARTFGPLPPLPREDLVPGDHCARHLERARDVSFVRTVVREASAEGSRPSIAPVVVFTLHLVKVFEGSRSERQRMRVVADRLRLRSRSRR